MKIVEYRTQNLIQNTDHKHKIVEWLNTDHEHQSPSHQLSVSNVGVTIMTINIITHIYDPDKTRLSWNADFCSGSQVRFLRSCIEHLDEKIFSGCTNIDWKLYRSSLSNYTRIIINTQELYLHTHTEFYPRSVWNDPEAICEQGYNQSH